MSAEEEGVTRLRRGCWHHAQKPATWQRLISVWSTLSKHRWSIPAGAARPQDHVAIEILGFRPVLLVAQSWQYSCAMGRTVVYNIKIGAEDDDASIRKQISEIVATPQESAVLVLVKAAPNSNTFGEVFGSAFPFSVSSNHAEKFLTQKRTEFMSSNVGWGAAWNGRQRVGVLSRDIVRWGSGMIEFTKQLRLVDVQCRKGPPPYLGLYFEDDHITVSAAKKAFFQLARDLNVDPKSLFVSFSQDGWFWPNTNFAQQNPLEHFLTQPRAYP